MTDPLPTSAEVRDIERAYGPAPRIRAAQHAATRKAVLEEVRDFCAANGFPFPVKYDGEILRLTTQLGASDAQA